ncbi:Uncharacterised protein [Halioglobus japonicus]|nr:Uncharacterised protein [Halioglobus japonicus]
MSRSYKVTVLGTAIIASICIVAFSFIVDPYKMYPSVPGLSPETSIDLLFVKHLHTPFAVESARPTILVAGNSRSATFPPDLLSNSDEVAYNASIPGTSLRDIRRMVEHAQAINPLKLVFIGVDTELFLKSAWDSYDPTEALQQASIAPQFELLAEVIANNSIPENHNRYRKIDPSLSERWRFLFHRVEDYWRSLFSLDAIMDSWRIVFGSGASGEAFHDDGTWDLEGKNQSPTMARYQRMAQQVYASSLTAKPAGYQMDQLVELLDFTEKNQIQTVLFILPMQGLLLNTLEFADAWELHLEWQRELVKQVNAHNSATKIYGVEDQEKIVLDEVGAPQALFIDGIHLSRAAGTEILTCLQGPCNSNIQPTLLTQESIETYLKNSELLRDQYAKKYPKHLTKTRWRLGLL